MKQILHCQLDWYSGAKESIQGCIASMDTNRKGNMWKIGKFLYQVREMLISKDDDLETKERKKKLYGNKSIETMSTDLKYCTTNLYYARNFYLNFPDPYRASIIINDPLIPWTKLREALVENSRHPNIEDYLNEFLCWNFKEDMPMGDGYDTQFDGKLFIKVTANIIHHLFMLGKLSRGAIACDPFAGGNSIRTCCRHFGLKCHSFDIEDRPDTIRANSCEKIPLPDNSVDLVIADPPYLDKIQYGDNPNNLCNVNYSKYLEMMESFGKEAKRILKKHGILVFINEQVVRNNGRETFDIPLDCRDIFLWKLKFSKVGLPRHYARYPEWVYRDRMHDGFLKTNCRDILIFEKVEK